MGCGLELAQTDPCPAEAPADLALLARYADTRDEQTFASLVERHQDLVFSAAYQVLRDRSLADDVAQDTFWELARHPLAVREHVAAWLHLTARNRARNLLRSRRRHETHVAAIPAATPDADADPEALTCALVHLDASDRDLLLRRFVHEQPLARLAEECGCAVSTIHERLRAALDRLRRRLALSCLAIPWHLLDAHQPGRRYLPPAHTTATTTAAWWCAAAAALGGIAAVVLAQPAPAIPPPSVLAVPVPPPASAPLALGPHETADWLRLTTLAEPLGGFPATLPVLLDGRAQSDPVHATGGAVPVLMLAEPLTAPQFRIDCTLRFVAFGRQRRTELFRFSDLVATPGTRPPGHIVPNRWHRFTWERRPDPQGGSISTLWLDGQLQSESRIADPQPVREILGAGRALIEVRAVRVAIGDETAAF
jgi:RNA polymerase sigma-70 factor (ECF subfamily)